MTQFTTDIMQALVKKEDISEVFRKHLETAVNTLLQTELTAFLDYEKYDRIGFNSGNSWNGVYTRILHTEYGNLTCRFHVTGTANSTNRRSLRTSAQTIRWSPLSFTCSKKASRCPRSRI